ncbi:MAG: hypothetical protein HKN59_05110 [Gammaproteobacteria bacterium]|nr:hypothetical protein [Gammaproteobacteria bacterium]
MNYTQISDMRKTGIPLIFALGLLAATGSTSFAADGWYVSATGGFSFAGDESAATLTDGGGSTTTDLEFDSGIAAGASVGRWITDQFRAEVDWVYRSNSNDRVSTADSRSASDGNLASSALSINGYFHFGETDVVGQFSPFVGAGIAYVNEVDIDLEGGDFGALYEDLEDDGVGFQMMLGAAYRQSDALRWTAELRWLSFGDADLQRSDGTRLADLGYDPLGAFLSVSYEF